MADAVSRLKELDAERAKLLDEALREALSRAEAAVADLNALGFEYALLSPAGVPGRGRPKGSAKKRTRRMKNAPCVICKFQTSPPHDARKHRFSQGKKKHPFTAKELADLGLKKIA
jgi:transposase